MTALCCAFALLACWALPSAHAGDALEAAYAEAKAAYRSLSRDTKARQRRDLWLKAIAGLMKVYEDAVAAEHARADDALFLAGRATAGMASVSALKGDQTTAVERYRELAQRFPKSNLADDALLHAARLALDTLHDAPLAAALLDQLLTHHRGGDMVVDAKSLRVSDAFDGVKPAALATADAKKATESAPVPVLDIAYGETGGRTRVIVHTERPVEFATGEVPPKGDGKPPRLFVDLENAVMPGEKIRTVKLGRNEQKHLRRIRAAQNDADTVRVVLDLTAPHAYEVAARSGKHGHGLVLLVGDERPAMTATSVAPAAARPQPAARPRPAPEVQKKAPTGRPREPVTIEGEGAPRIRKICIDAGHGGKDPGAIGRGGLKEKFVTLDVARRVGRLLRKKGLEVVMTREKDRFISLTERTAVANAASADLFLSIHANAHQNRTFRGVETYYYDTTNDDYSLKLAQRENAVVDAKEGGLDYILADLAFQADVDDSARLAGFVQQSMIGALRGRYKRVKDHGVKGGPFFVLYRARMPSVLLEVSFISNRLEERRLRTKKYRQALAESIVKGVEAYMEDHRLAYGRRR